MSSKTTNNQNFLFSILFVVLASLTVLAFAKLVASTRGEVAGLIENRFYNSSSFINQPIPANATYTREDRIGSIKPNEEEWSAPIYRVPQGESHPLVTVVNNYSGRTHQWPIPTYAQPTIEDDHHMIVMYKHNNVAYEFWDAQWSGTTRINAGGMKDYPIFGTSATGITSNTNHRVIAAGFALMAGMTVREDFETASGQLDPNMRIEHALTMSLNASLINKEYVAPAVGGEEAGSGGANGIPMGARFAIPKNVDVESLNVHPLTKALLRAIRDYGIYVNDGNGTPQYQGKHVGTIRVERGLSQQLFGETTTELDERIRNEIYNVISQHGLYRVTGGTLTSTTTTPSSSTTTSTSRSSSSTSTVSSTISSSSTVSSTASSTSKSSSSSTTVRACALDTNRNGSLDIVDFLVFAQNYKVANINCSLDIVGNNCYLDVADLQEFASNYKIPNRCPVP